MVNDVPLIPSTESHDDSCDLSTSWIDIEPITDDSHTGVDNKEERILYRDYSVVVDDTKSLDLTKEAVIEEIYTYEESSAIPADAHDSPKSRQTSQAQNSHKLPQSTGSEEKQSSEEISNTVDLYAGNDSHQRYVEIVDTRFETVEGYDWEGISDLQKRMKKQQDEIHQPQEDVTALRWVTQYRLYLTDGLLEESTEEATLALNDAPRYEIAYDKNKGKENNDHCNDPAKDCNKDVKDDYVEFIESNKTEETIINDTVDSSSKDQGGDGEEYAFLSLSPLDILTNSLLGASSFHAGNRHHCVQLIELIVGGPSLELGESSIERLAKALVVGGRDLKKLVLIVSAIDLPAMKALAECFCAGSLEDLHFYAGRTTERLVASRSRYQSVHAPNVLGPGISSWVDVWTSKNPSSGSQLRSLNLSRMDIGDEAAFALSRLLLAAPALKILSLAQDDFHGGLSTSTSCPQNKKDSNEGKIHPPLSFAGTKRLLESLILIEDIKNRSQLLLEPSMPHSYSNLLELDISGWVLEDDEIDDNGKICDDDDDKVVDNFYDNFNFIDGGCSEDDFDFANNGNINASVNCATKRKERACCVIASMLRVNTSLQKLVLATEDGCADAYSSGFSEADKRGLLSVQSTLAIARALRDHISISSISINGNTTATSNGQFQSYRRRPFGSDLRTLVLFTNYTRGTTRGKNKCEDTSSWVITERKRAIAKVFIQALKDQPIHKIRLQQLSCTTAFRGLEPLVLGCGIASNDSIGTNQRQPSKTSTDLQNQLECLLQRNRDINQSLKNIQSFWLPLIYSLGTMNECDASDEENEEDDDCQFVEAIDFDAGSPPAAAREGQHDPPSVMVLALPNLLTKLGREAAYHDVLYSCTRALATETNLLEVAAEHRFMSSLRYRRKGKFRGIRSRSEFKSE